MLYADFTFIFYLVIILINCQTPIHDFSSFLYHLRFVRDLQTYQCFFLSLLPFSICKCLNVGKYEQRVLEGLEAMKLPCGKVRVAKSRPDLETLFCGGGNHSLRYGCPSICFNQTTVNFEPCCNEFSVQL